MKSRRHSYKYGNLFSEGQYKNRFIIPLEREHILQSKGFEKCAKFLYRGNLFQGGAVSKKSVHCL